MSYNKYNTRTSGRYNTPGQFVAAGEQPFQPQSYSAQPPLPPQPAPPRQATPQRAPIAPRAPPPHTPQPPHTPHIPQPALNTQASPAQQAQKMNMQPADVEMKCETKSECSGESTPRPHWMKNKLAGVKKISNKERRRRQNENLRRLLTPKNALMVLNEMMPNEQLATQFKVEPAASQFYKAASAHSFCADLTLDGNIYKGYGENKLSARNAAAEKAIRDLIIKRMTKAFTTDVKEDSTAQGTDTPAETPNAEAEEALPMIQLASFALHKLFSEWEYEGIKVPQLKVNPAGQQQQGGEAPVVEHVAPTPPKPKPPMKRKELPPNAASLHPCMLLTYMRPGLEYRELAVSGDKPQTMLFTMGVDVDGATYIGKASNKKEARRSAARSACAALFGVQFPDAPAPGQQEL